MKLKKLLSILTVSVLMVGTLAACSGGSTGTSTPAPSAAPTVDPAKYAVTKPITIDFWHALESQYQPTLNKIIADFQTKNPNVKVNSVYQGSYADLNEKLVAAQAAGTTLPALTVSSLTYLANYGDANLPEDLGPYISGTKYDINDFGAGLRKGTSYNGKQLAVPFQISTNIMYYNKDMAKAEGITIPTKWTDMDAFVNKVGKPERLALIIPGWDQFYFEPWFYNNGVKVVNDDMKSTDINSEKALAISNQFKKWVDAGKAGWAYGKDSSANMRQNFLDGKAFAVLHTTSLYNMYKDNAKFEVGMAWLPGTSTSLSLIGGNGLLIPAKNSQDVKNAAWQLLTYLTTTEVIDVIATETGYMPTRISATKGDLAKKFLEKKPAFQVVFDHLDDINPRVQHPAYTKLASLWREALAKSIIEHQDMKAQLDNAKKLGDEALSD